MSPFFSVTIVTIVFGKSGDPSDASAASPTCRRHCHCSTIIPENFIHACFGTILVPLMSQNSDKLFRTFHLGIFKWVAHATFPARLVNFSVCEESPLLSKGTHVMGHIGPGIAQFCYAMFIVCIKALNHCDFPFVITQFIAFHFFELLVGLSFLGHVMSW